MLKLINCPVCNRGEWKDISDCRNKQYWIEREYIKYDEDLVFKICKNCGFTTYDYFDEKELAERYNRERKVMSFNNIITCNRKNIYHDKFLGDKDFVVKIFKDKNKKCLDVGCAQGAFLDYISMFRGSTENIYGTEYSESFKAFGKYEYGLNITKEIDESLKYDFISYYHVLEHVQNPNKELTKIRSLLTDDGILYISVPVWESCLDEHSGGITVDFENYYHLNHVNVFTKISIKNLIKSRGFTILYEDDELYGYTFICKKSEYNHEFEKENFEMIENRIRTQRDAIIIINQKKHDECISLYPDFQDVYIFKSLNIENQKSFDNQIKILEEGLSKCSKKNKLLSQIGRVFYQWDENKPDKQFYSNNIKKSEDIFLDQVKKRGLSDDICFYLGMINGKYKKDYATARSYMRAAIDINPAKWQECMNWISYFWKEKEKDGGDEKLHG